MNPAWSRSPWFSFFCFLGIDLFLTFLPAPELWPVLGALLLLGSVLFLESRHARGRMTSGPAPELLGDFPRVLWIALLGLVVLSRSYHLAEPWPWPNRDEGLHGMLGLSLAQHWSWQFFYTFGQHPPFLIWGLRFFLDWFSSPFLGLGALPALAGFAAWVLGTLVFRLLFSRSLVLVGSALLGLGLWSFYAGRWCQQGSLIPPWAFLCFLLLLRALRERDPLARKAWTCALGFAAGLGSFLFTVWPVGVAMVVLGLFGGGEGAGERRRELIPYFLVPLLAALAPFFLAIHREGFGTHLWAMSAASGWFSVGHQVLTVLSYIAALFWGKWEGDACYTADSGGFLDPIWGAVFFVGAARLWSRRQEPFARWVLACSFLGLLPGFLSMNVEMFRVIGFLPFLYGITAWGAESLLREVRGTRARWLLLLTGLALGSAWNGYGFLRYRVQPELHADHWSAQPGALEYRRAWEVLSGFSRERGPGWILTEFLETPDDQTPWVTGFPINAAANPALDPARAGWAALLVHKDYGPSLSSWFPEGRVLDLGKGLEPNLGRCLFLVPLNERTRPRWDRWRVAHRRFRALSDAIDTISGPRTYAAALALFGEGMADLPPDPFLAACFWEKKAQFLYDHGFQEHYEEQCDALRHAVAALPLFHLRYELGCLLMRRGHWAEAREELRAALAQRPGDPSVQEVLGILRDREQENPSHSKDRK